MFPNTLLEPPSNFAPDEPKHHDEHLSYECNENECDDCNGQVAIKIGSKYQKFECEHICHDHEN